MSMAASHLNCTICVLMQVEKQWGLLYQRWTSAQNVFKNNDSLQKNTSFWQLL